MNKKDEYLMLREELNWRLNAINTLGTFMYTIYATILGFALSFDVVELFLLPYVVIVPVVLKVANHKYNVVYIAGYCSKILEDDNFFQWETLSAEYHSKYKRTAKEKVVYYGSSIEYLLMSILSAILFWVKYNNLSNIVFTTLQLHLYIFLQIGIILFVAYITFSYFKAQKLRGDIFEKWGKIK